VNLDPRLLRQAWSSRAAFIAAVSLGFIGGIWIILQARTISQIAGRVFLQGETLAGIYPSLVGLLVIIFLRAITVFLSEGAAGAVAVRVKNNLRQMLSRRIFELGPAYVQGERSGELSAVVVDGVENLDAYFSQYLPQLVLAAAVPVAILVVVFPLDLLTGIVLLLTAPLIPLFMILIGKAGEALTKRQWVTLSRMSAYFLDTLQGLTTLKLLGRSQARTDEIEQVSERYRAVTIEVLRVTFLSAFALELVATISTAVVAVEIGLRLLAGRIAFEQGFFLLLLAPEFYLPIRLLGQRFHAGMSGISAAVRIFEVLDAPAPLAPANRPAAASSLLKIAEEELRFEQVSYSYPGRSVSAVRDVSFTILPGQQTALVGASGAGKSTIAMLLLRFIEPQSGAIYIGERQLQDIPASSWRTQVAWVSQQPHLFHATIAENLRLAKPGASQFELRRAAKLAYLDDWIAALPLGYDTPLGEAGGGLSGGQAQRLALARAFLKDAPLLVMDEPTAHLDPEQESLLEEVTQRLCAQRRVILIAHRLPTVYRSNSILLMEDGRVAEAGTHAVLLRQRGKYFHLVQAYQDGAI
jgi:ATP-binding cassette, subfamily C, bacterial CydD